MSKENRFMTILAVLTLLQIVNVRADVPEIDVDMRQTLHPVSRYLTGACLEDVNHEVYGGLYSQMIFGESFQEPAPAEPLAGFAEYGGTWQATNGVLFSSKGSGPKLMDDGVSQSNGDIKVQLEFASNEGGDAGIIFQASELGMGADVFTGYEVSLSPAGYVVLGRHRQDWEPIRRVSCPVPTGQWINLEVQYINASINVLVNGSSLIQYTDAQSPLMNGQIGLRNYQQDAQFQDFRINGEKVSLAYETNHWPGEVSGMWKPVMTGSARGQCVLETSNVFVGRQSQRITFSGGTGAFGVANQSLNHWGMNFIAGKEYDGCLDVRADAPVPVMLSLERADGSRSYAQTSLLVTSNDWEHLNFSLTPSASGTNGQFVITLTQPGSVVVGYAFLEMGAWGRFDGLPVRRDVAQLLVDQGITVMRYGGSMVNAAGYRWTNMIGPRELRPPYNGLWYPYSSNGWGIFDFLNFCEAAGFLGIPDFNINETPQDMEDFVEYANGPTNTTWGAKRMADGHPQPYNVKHIELGNEERVDDTYYQKFQALAQAIWARDTNMTLVVGDLAYSQLITNPFSFSGAASGVTTLAAHQKILRLAARNHRPVWFDVHVWDDGPTLDPSLAAMFSYRDALAQIAGGADYKVVVFELNANHPNQGRALGNALAIQAAERDGRLPIVTSANCLQPDGQNDNGWDQGLLFLNPAQAWLQPAGYVTQMFSHHYEPFMVESKVEPTDGPLSVTAMRNQRGTVLVLKVVNLSSKPIPAVIVIRGHLPSRSATVEELAGKLNEMNSSDEPGRIRPVISEWTPHFKNNRVNYTFAPDSFTIIQFGK
jgi:hypothetical protein